MPSVQTRVTAAGAKRYVVRVRAYGRQTSTVHDTKAAAERFARDVEQRGGQWAFDNWIRENEIAAEPTLDEWAARHFTALTNVGAGAMANYRRDYTRRWSPHLGHLHLSQITREDVAKALNAQTGADKTVANAWGVLASMFKTAVLDGLIPSSPARAISLPKRTSHETEEHRYLTHDEFWQLLEDTPTRYRPLVWTLAGTGMRWGEATALTVGDVDVARATVRIVKAWKRDPETGSWYVGPPKTKKSRRTVTLPAEVVDALRPLAEGRKRGELLFTNRNGDQVKHQPFYREHWRKRCVTNLPQPRPRIHDLRHSHVAWLIAQGVSLPVIQARLGHEKITTTIDTYGHLLPDLQIAAAAAASKALGSPRGEIAG